MGDASRAAMLIALMGGLSLPASELARHAGISASTATSHLRRLVEARLLVVRPQGRHRYFALSGPDVAEALEHLATLGLGGRRRAASNDALSMARTCFSHLAGRIAVAFWTRAVQAGWVAWTEPSVRLLPVGATVLARSGLAAEGWEGTTGATCLDLSERVPHVSGRLGVILCAELVARGWVKRMQGTRALRVTTRGQAGFRSLGVTWEE